MFSKKMVMAVGVILLIAVNIIILSVNSRRGSNSSGIGRIAVFFISPFQDAVTYSIRSVQNIWHHYFALVSTSQENDALKRELKIVLEEKSQCKEIELSNQRLRSFLNFQKTKTGNVLAAEVIGKDPSSWYKTIIIDKGKSDGVEKGLPIVVPEGIAGQVIDVSYRYSKVLLIIDRNSSVDALVQRSRARGIVKGELIDQCSLTYVLNKHDIREGDTVISSGLDGVYPKGLRIGRVSGVVRRNAGIFQDVVVTPYVDFEKLEEVLIVLNPPKYVFTSK